jgi:hypothetical protein
MSHVFGIYITVKLMLAILIEIDLGPLPAFIGYVQAFARDIGT